MLGYALASLFRRAGSKAQVLLFAGLTGVLSILGTQVWIGRLGLEDSVLTNCAECSEGAYYGLHPLCALCGYGIIALEYVLASLITTLSREKIPAVLSRMSRNVMEIYIAQWVLIGFLSPLLIRIESIWLNLGAGILILLASCRGAELYLKLIKRHKNAAKAKEYLLH